MCGYTYTADKDVHGRGKTRVSDPHHFNADPESDPDPAFHFNADQHPTFPFNADQDPAFPFNAGPEPDPHQGDANLRPLTYRPSRPPF
jgi:hypothetical protein